jgi:hypothetical protein
MQTRLDQTRRAVPVTLGLVTLMAVGVLLAWDVSAASFPAGAHDFLAAFPLAVIAVAYLIHQAVHRPAPLEIFKAVLLASAFLFWAANQLWPESPRAPLLNDFAIGLFVLDIFLTMIEWPSSSVRDQGKTSPVRS